MRGFWHSLRGRIRTSPESERRSLEKEASLLEEELYSVKERLAQLDDPS